MNLKRTATIVVVGAAFAAWLAAAATSGRHTIIRAPLVERAAAIDARGEALAKEVARLHERLRPSATPSQPGRNLFEFTARLRPAPAIVRPAVTEAPPPTPVAPVATPLPFKLIGLAEDQGRDGVLRTAIISGSGQLFIVKEGQTVTLRYRVVKISADVVELVDLVDNSTVRLALK